MYKKIIISFIFGCIVSVAVMVYFNGRQIDKLNSEHKARIESIEAGYTELSNRNKELEDSNSRLRESINYRQDRIREATEIIDRAGKDLESAESRIDRIIKYFDEISKAIKIITDTTDSVVIK